MIDQIEASVAPPRLMTSACGAKRAMRGTRAGDIQSPLSHQPQMVEEGLPFSNGPPAAKSWHRVPTVTWWVSIARVHASGSDRRFCGGKTRHPPTLHTPNMSKMDRSNVGALRPSTRSLRSIAKRSTISLQVLAAPRWVIAIALSTPVVPEMNIT
jgi:hypothetical protein